MLATIDKRRGDVMHFPFMDTIAGNVTSYDPGRNVFDRAAAVLIGRAGAVAVDACAKLGLGDQHDGRSRKRLVVGIKDRGLH